MPTQTRRPPLARSMVANARPERQRVRRKQRLVHDTADVVLAQDGRMKPVAGSARPARRHAIFLSRSPLRSGTGRPMLL